VLVIVLVLVALAGLITTTLLLRTTATASAAAGTLDGQQARSAAMSGIARALAVLASPPEDPAALLDDPETFRHQLVFEDGERTWYFTIYAAADDGEVRYGLADEAGRLNINVADEQVLLGLPGMTPEMAAALADYIDKDGDVRPEGAEQDFYNELDRPYAIRNGWLTTAEELLLVRGFGGQVVYGEDANFNGLLDANEDDGDESFPPDNGDGVLDAGLRALTTTLTYEPQVDSEGRPRIDLNGPVEALAAAGLPAATVEFIRLYREDDDKNLFAHPSELLEMRYQLKKDHTAGSPPGRGPRGRRRPGGQGNVTHRAGEWIESGAGPEQMELVLDRLTASPEGRAMPVRMGMVNVNTAPRQVLGALLGEDGDKAAEIIDARATASLDSVTPAWLLTSGLVEAETFKRIAPRLTARSWQYRIRSVGYCLPAGRYCVIEAVVDLAGQRPRILYMRDLTRLGLPLALDGESENSQ
jgi:type II secretory pathway component PulK